MCVYLCIGGLAGPGCCGQYEASAGGRGPAAVAAALRDFLLDKTNKSLPTDLGEETIEVFVP